MYLWVHISTNNVSRNAQFDFHGQLYKTISEASEEYCRAWQDEDPSMTRFRYNDCSSWLTIGKHYSLVNILLHNFHFIR